MARATTEDSRAGRVLSEERVELLPGVEGPRWVNDDRFVISSRQGGAVALSVRVEYDDSVRRYVCTEFRAFRAPDAQEGKGFITSETLRGEGLVRAFIAVMLNVSDDPDLRVTQELPNPGGVEPWGWTPPPDVSDQGPTDRALAWVGHLYRLAMAVSLNPARAVEDTLKLSRSTAARWIRLARQRGYLGPSEGPGRAAG